MTKEDKYRTYSDLLVKWQNKINLVGHSTLQDLETRHFEDSRQLIPFIQEKDQIIADLGSGAGFPGMVLAIEGFPNVHLIESDQRKSIFLKEVSRETSTKVEIHNERVEKVALKADLITCRAFASLLKILDISAHMAKKETEYLILKSDDYERELTEAQNHWYFEASIHPSRTDPRGRVILLKNLLKKQ